MTTEKVDQLFGYVQERCLWQFFSRTWDRKENLDGIFSAATEFLTGKTPKRETPMEKLFYADAKIMVKDFEERFPWIKRKSPPMSSSSSRASRSASGKSASTSR